MCVSPAFLCCNTHKIFENLSWYKLPIVYNPGYNLTIHPYVDSLVRLFHPFDVWKYAKIYKHLVESCGVSEDAFYEAVEVSHEDLLKVHTKEYLNSLSSSFTISRAVNMKEALGVIPNHILDKAILKPMRLATGGTIQATKLALQYGWAINLSGGYHHARKEGAGGGCIYGDIQLAIEKLWEEDPNLRILIVDLDAHQGDGYEEYFKDHEKSYLVKIFDMYNKNEYPYNNSTLTVNECAADRINKQLALDGGKLVCKVAGWDVSALDYAHLTERIENRRINEEEYLGMLKEALGGYLDELKDELPDLIIYNAGTDPFVEDSWGCMAVSFDGMVARDEYVWGIAERYGIPIVMLLSGGYSSKSASIISQSIERILKRRMPLDMID